MGALVYVRLNGNITTLDVSKQLGRRPAKSAVADKVTNLKPMNILVMGVDTRDLGTTKFGTTPGDRSDTNLLLHLSADRKSAVVVSNPRDSMTQAPHVCKDPSSSVADGPVRQGTPTTAWVAPRVRSARWRATPVSSSTISWR